MTSLDTPILDELSGCGCCAAPASTTDAAPRQREGLPQIAYRGLGAGDYAAFRAAMLAALSRTAAPGRSPLRDLSTRDSDDFSIALLDSWAIIADILTFYQERFANEAYLGTATEQESVVELARLLGYRPRPGVSADVWLAFGIDEASVPTTPLTIDPGIKVQSIPGPGESAQIFETTESIEARAEWNAMTPRQTEPLVLQPADTELYLQGVATQLQPGDAILLIGDPEKGSTDPVWRFRELLTVTADAQADRTRITWEQSLGADPPTANLRAYAFRQRASLFGNNAPDPRTLSLPSSALLDGDNWKDFTLPTVGGQIVIDLDAQYQKVVPGSWFILKRAPTIKRRSGDDIALYSAAALEHLSRVDFAISARITRILPDKQTNLENNHFPLRSTQVFAQSEELAIAERPITTPVSGNTITLDREISPLPKGRSLIITGRAPGASSTDPTVSERVTVESSSGSPTRLLLQGAGLQNSYDPATATLAGNIAPASHGESVQETAGSGDASQSFQSFTLKQTPLAFLRSTSAEGMASTLEVRIDDILWHEAISRHGRAPAEHIYTMQQDADGATTIQFGDGITGARPTTGQQNIRLSYRKGGGLAGLVGPGQLTQLLSRPSGVRDVTNPLAAEGASDPETIDDARTGAPRTVLTLGRIISLQDYEDFARAYPGIAKAQATWLWTGRRRGVLLTIAGPGGASLSPTGDVTRGLFTAIAAAADPFTPVEVLTFRQALFDLSADVHIHPDHRHDDVLAAARETLLASFSFDARAFAQPAALSEVLAAFHTHAGITAVTITHFQRTDQAHPLDPAPRLPAAQASGSIALGLRAAELLSINPASLDSIRAAS